MLKTLVLRPLIQHMKEWADDRIDELEDKIANDDIMLQGEIDDQIAQKIIDLVREVMDIPDDIGGDED